MTSVLIVEDEDDVRAVLSEIVQLFGFHVKALSDGNAAWREISTSDHDLVITDLGLPGMDGIGLLNKMRANGIMTPVLLITGVEMDGSAIKPEKAAGYELVQKPFAIDDLKKAITRLLDNYGSKPRKQRESIEASTSHGEQFRKKRGH